MKQTLTTIALLAIAIIAVAVTSDAAYKRGSESCVVEKPVYESRAYSDGEILTLRIYRDET